MKNPWLDIPIDDYEGHMRSPEVDQLQILNELFATVLEEFSPRSVAVLGCAAGNGFEHINPGITKRIIGVDINPAYHKVLHGRFSQCLPNLNLTEQDLASPAFFIPSVEMAFAALVFEYVPIVQSVQNIDNSLIPGEILVAALQLPSMVSGSVTKTEFCSLETLGQIMKLVELGKFTHVCSANGLDLEKEEAIPMKQGKFLFVGYYRKRI